MRYINRSMKGDFEVATALDGGSFMIGTTYEDYTQGKWIELTDAMASFRDAHPGANIKEVIEMEMMPLPEPPPAKTFAELVAEKEADLEGKYESAISAAIGSPLLTKAVFGLLDDTEAASAVLGVKSQVDWLKSRYEELKAAIEAAATIEEIEGVEIEIEI
jgi:hypothetical protein